MWSIEGNLYPHKNMFFWVRICYFGISGRKLVSIQEYALRGTTLLESEKKDMTGYWLVKRSRAHFIVREREEKVLKVGLVDLAYICPWDFYSYMESTLENEILLGIGSNALYFHAGFG